MALQDNLRPQTERLISRDTELQKIVNLHAGWLEKQLHNLHIDGFTVSKSVKSVDAGKFKNTLTVAIGKDFSPDKFAIFLNGLEQLPEENKLPILPLLLLPDIQGSPVLMDQQSQALFTDGFWMCEDKTLQYISPTNPVQLDGMISLGDDIPSNQKILDTNERLHPLTVDKQKTKELLTAAGVLVPPGIFIRHTEKETIAERISNLKDAFDISEGFVVKQNDADHGDNVQLFDADKLPEAQKFVEELTEQGLDVIVEKRIIPMEPDGVRRKKRLSSINQPDHNSRILVTLSPMNPRAFDAEERIKESDSNPVNVSKGAQAKRLDDFYSPKIRERIFRTAEKATQVVCQAIATSPDEIMMGYSGIDTITDKHGKVYVLEVNGGPVGGINTLTQFDGKPLASVRDIFYPYTRDFLMQNHANRTDIIPHQLQRVSLGTRDIINLMVLFFSEGHLDLATKFVQSLPETIPAKFIRYFNSFVKKFAEAEKLEEAARVMEIIANSSQQ